MRPYTQRRAHKFAGLIGRDWEAETLDLVRDICANEREVDAQLVSSKFQSASFGSEAMLLFRVETTIDAPAYGRDGKDFWNYIADEVQKEFNWDVLVEIRDGYDELGAGFEAKWVRESRFSKQGSRKFASGYDRDEMISWIEKTMEVAGTSEEFYDRPGGIWLCGECGDEYKGRVIYDYYADNYQDNYNKYEFGVLIKWEEELNKRGWYSEWYDAGTVMVWPI